MSMKWRIIAGIVLLTAVIAVAGYLTGREAYASSAGPSLAGAGADNNAVGTATWSSPSNITLDNGSSFAFIGSFSFGVTSHYLEGSSFNFSIPTGATIDGIMLSFKKANTSQNGTVHDSTVSLVTSGGSVSGDNKATATAWPISLTNATYGSSSDLWGLSWSPSDINNSNFGAVVSATKTSGPTDTIEATAMKITVYYTTSGGSATQSATQMIMAEPL